MDCKEILCNSGIINRSIAFRQNEQLVYNMSHFLMGMNYNVEYYIYVTETAIRTTLGNKTRMSVLTLHLLRTIYTRSLL